jgi:hypothetical protein
MILYLLFYVKWMQMSNLFYLTLLCVGVLNVNSDVFMGAA